MFNNGATSLIPMGVLGGLHHQQDNLWAPQQNQGNPPPFNPPAQPPLYNPQTQQTFTQGTTFDRPSASNTYASVWTDEKVVDAEDRILIDGLEPHEIPQSARLWIGGLNWDTSEQALLSYFSYFGKVLQVNIMRDKRTGRSRGFGFIVFERTTSVDKVMEERARIHIDGRKITCERALHKHEMDSMESQNKFKKVFVGGLNPQSTEESLRQHFKNYGKLEDVLIVRNRTGGRSRGFGFITYGEFEDVDCVMESEHVVDGFLVECKRAVPNRYKVEDQTTPPSPQLEGLNEMAGGGGGDRKRGGERGNNSSNNHNNNRKKNNRAGDNQRGSAGAALSSLTPSVSWEVQNVAVQPQPPALNLGGLGATGQSLGYGLSPLAGMGGVGGMYPGLGQGGGGMVGGGLGGVMNGMMKGMGGPPPGTFYPPVMMAVQNHLAAQKNGTPDQNLNVNAPLAPQAVGPAQSAAAGRPVLLAGKITPGGAVPVGPAIITSSPAAAGLGQKPVCTMPMPTQSVSDFAAQPTPMPFQRSKPFLPSDTEALQVRQTAGLRIPDSTANFQFNPEPIKLSDPEQFLFCVGSEPRFYPNVQHAKNNTEEASPAQPYQESSNFPESSSPARSVSPPSFTPFPLYDLSNSVETMDT
eukprot:gb/GEZN01002297.1/.p1 GENE.gb/GEZN01002297.1/~~gb/GEZN01002297.1/.p1  ORF type:complete len:637 (+),score=108.60 gb/GEZN01002297.1/:185-2095(+)